MAIAAVCSVQVGLETICVIICSLMLVSVFKTGQNYMSEQEEAEFMERCKMFVNNYR
jgi:calcium release-activated calcium channel protein 1